MKDKKGMFTGFCKVFNFTASQNFKEKGFKLSTVLIAAVIAVIFAAISVVPAALQKNSDESDDGMADEFDIDGTEIYYINETDISDELVLSVANTEIFKSCSFIKVSKEETEEAKSDVNAYLSGKTSALLMLISEDEDSALIKYYLPYDTEITEETAENIGEAFAYCCEYISVSQIEGLDGEYLELYNAGVYQTSLVAGEESESAGIIIAKILLPMLLSLLLYMMILLYGQNVTKIVVAEKSSKLMETLLTSVRPYALIAGKITAVVFSAVFQLVIWVIFGATGYIIGVKAAEAINPDYINYVSLVIDMIIKESSGAFSAGAVIIAIITVIIGFFMYSVLAGLVAALVDKMEDLSSVMAIFQIPVVIGFLGAYFVSMSENETLKNVVMYCPVTSPFYIPSVIMVGDANIALGIAALLIIVVVTLGLIVFTGRVYKGRLFNRH